jgi:predicted P-loop ATPase
VSSVLTDDKKVININKEAADKLKQEQTHKTLFEETKDGSLKTTSVKNVVLILKTDKNLQNLFKFNEFTNEVDVVRNAELKTSIGKINIAKGQYTDQVINGVELYIESSSKYKGAIFKNNVIDQGITNVAYMNSYNPVIDYMNEAYAKWDKKQRLDNYFVDFLGAPNNKTTALITELWFMGAVAKAYNPKTKFDFVLDLVGGQGVGKTSLLQKTAPMGLYTDQFNTFSNKDDFEVMKNALIVNDDEMTASNAASFEEIKKFITMQQFEYRKAYARKSETFQKKFVLARTTNEIKHLKDRSGDRRFISIFADVKHQKKSPITDLTDEYVQQVWGEAVWLYKNTKNPFLLSENAQKLLEENRKQFRYTSGLEDELNIVLENKFKNSEFIPNTKLAFALFADRDALSRNSKEARDIRYYMGHLGYEVGARKKVDGKVVAGFAKLQ